MTEAGGRRASEGNFALCRRLSLLSGYVRGGQLSAVLRPLPDTASPTPESADVRPTSPPRTSDPRVRVVSRTKCPLEVCAHGVAEKPRRRHRGSPLPVLLLSKMAVFECSNRCARVRRCADICDFRPGHLGTESAPSPGSESASKLNREGARGAQAFAV
jgi:hypothetical protein